MTKASAERKLKRVVEETGVAAAAEVVKQAEADLVRDLPQEWSMTELEHERLAGTLKDTTIIQQQHQMSMQQVGAKQAAWADGVAKRLGIPKEIVLSRYDMNVETGVCKLKPEAPPAAPAPAVAKPVEQPAAAV